MAITIPKDHRSVRLLHGRGNLYPEMEHIVIDYFHPNLYVTLFKDKENTDEILKSLKDYPVQNIIVQKRYLHRPEFYALKGEIPESGVAIEQDLKFNLTFGTSQNIGFFLDMAKGREWLLQNSKNKKVLNLFSYTCSLSVAALKGGASEVVNVDMSKSALKVGEENHRINNLNLKNVKFLPYDIMKSWNAIFRNGPYDIIVIDPPTNQGESFKVERDYHKIIKRLKEMTTDNSVVLACLNSPHIKSDFLIDLFKEHAPEFIYIETIRSAFHSMEKNPEEGLKILSFGK